MGVSQLAEKLRRVGMRLHKEHFEETQREEEEEEDCPGNERSLRGTSQDDKDKEDRAEAYKGSPAELCPTVLH